ncbi:hypothetical protein B0H19DRAFT_1085137 [Mycena capillaripes]|nr:hypothetical protein B0H19DRAFT_1085137 [Mycena capillaripes]
MRMQYNYGIGFGKTTLKNLDREHRIVSACRPLPERQSFAELCMHSIQVALPCQHRPVRCQCHGSGYIVHPTVVPNARCAFTIGQYLDLVESTGGIPIQITVDGGTEPQWLNSFLTSHPPTHLIKIDPVAGFLVETVEKKKKKAPALCSAKGCKSSDNIPIKALWSYFLKYARHDLKVAILLDKTENYINVANELHIIVQNTHKTRKQSNKCLYLRRSFSIPAGILVHLNVVHDLRNTLPKSSGTAFVGFHLTLIYVRLQLTNLWEARN